MNGRTTTTAVPGRSVATGIVAALPRAPTMLGALKPDQWYDLPAGQYDPHHGKPAKVAMLVRATNAQ